MAGLALLGVVGWNSPVLGEGDRMQNRKAIEDIVDQYIANCELKTRMKASRSPSLQRLAALAVMKQAYCRDYREQLVEEMVAVGVEPKAYQVHYHLNSRFFDAIRPHTVAQR